MSKANNRNVDVKYKILMKEHNSSPNLNVINRL